MTVHADIYGQNRIALMYHVYADLSMPSNSDMMEVSTVHGCIKTGSRKILFPLYILCVQIYNHLVNKTLVPLFLT